MSTHDDHEVDIRSLVEIFYSDPRPLMEWVEINAESLPADYRQLLDHDAHMTVTLESHHRTLVDVEVLEPKDGDGFYARRSLLRRQSDGAPVQFGIIRLAASYLQPEVLDKIRQGEIPLGRVLITHEVLRQVQLRALWRITPGEQLQSLLQLPPNAEVFGRTAIIVCDGKPAVHLLEIPLA